MPQYMLDTDTVSFALRGQGRVGTRLLEHRPSELCISSIALAELRFGAEARRSRRLHRLISTFVELWRLSPSMNPRRLASHPRGRAGSPRRADRHVRHPDGGTCPVIGVDVRHEQYAALRAPAAAVGGGFSTGQGTRVSTRNGPRMMPRGARNRSSLKVPSRP